MVNTVNYIELSLPFENKLKSDGSWILIIHQLTISYTLYKLLTPSAFCHKFSRVNPQSIVSLKRTIVDKIAQVIIVSV